jgi:hypothetical protein
MSNQDTEEGSVRRLAPRVLHCTAAAGNNCQHPAACPAGSSQLLLSPAIAHVIHVRDICQLDLVALQEGRQQQRQGVRLCQQAGWGKTGQLALPGLCCSPWAGRC